MSKFRKGDIVGRISYNKDVIFEISKIIKTSNKSEIIILKGITERIEADSSPEDLEIIDKRTLNNKLKILEDKISERIAYCLKNPKDCICNSLKNGEKRSIKVTTGKILHLDGDKRYADKSMKYYKSLGLNAVVKSIPENKQPMMIRGLLERYNPDVLIITGHDGMIKKGTAFNDIYNYRNSRHFINTVNEAKKWDGGRKNLAIFARCMSKLL